MRPYSEQKTHSESWVPVYFQIYHMGKEVLYVNLVQGIKNGPYTYSITKPKKMSRGWTRSNGRKETLTPFYYVSGKWQKAAEKPVEPQTKGR